MKIINASIDRFRKPMSANAVRDADEWSESNRITGIATRARTNGNVDTISNVPLLSRDNYLGYPHPWQYVNTPRGFDRYRLPDGRIAFVDGDIARAWPGILFTLANGEIVWGVRVGPQ
jgi:hypothetical protein